MYLLSSDEDALTGFRLSGVQGKMIGDGSELESALKNAEDDKDIAVLLITDELFERFGDKIYEFRRRAPFVVTQIPNSQNKSPSSDSITRYIREAIGIKV